ncbi:hypothetical protein SAMN04487767_101508 [Bacillus wiedmannii]|uniref:Uncharacterized protein n=1 Tax=Bacillus wiedmannii TaxID=1890302 RepID=A0A1G6JTR4_9BACI|nr:hypothetical protein [Bacillus wiedmannii]SDC22068.1 hypothetical protein SAMN04487767_101508 [Bacillus wiedmannii]
MAEIRNLIRRISYDEPYSKTCYKKVLGNKVPYPCFGMQTKVIEIYSVAKYPDEATPQQKAAIAACAATAFKTSIAACKTAYASTTAATAGVGGIVAGAAACVKAGELAGRTAFDECKRKSLPHNIAKRTGWSIQTKKFNREHEESYILERVTDEPDESNQRYDSQETLYYQPYQQPYYYTYPQQNVIPSQEYPWIFPYGQ